MPRILIIDDQPYVQELFSEELAEECYTVVNVTQADSVREELKHLKPDLVLLDLYLNGFEGWDVLADIKGEDPHVPVLIFTAYDSYKDDPRLSQAEGYVIKSFGALDGLKQKIIEALG